jgi:diguanylate cyclase (GGDEF)-like protein
MALAKTTALERYSLHMGRLVQRHLADAALLAAKHEAEREAGEAKQAKREIEIAAEALKHEMAVRQQVQSRLSYLASHDPLTALPNRRLFNEVLEAETQKALRRTRKLALLYIDLDHFKDVNDTLGHAVGDRLLQQFSARIVGLLRAGDTLARFGGDEFALLQLDPEDAANAGELAGRLISALAGPFDGDTRPIFISASIGITMFPDDAGTVELLHTNADLAMYRAKNDGRNRSHFFDESLNKEVHRRSLLEQALRDPALLTQLQLVYQPQFELRTGRVSGVEALLRWQHPEHGVISPDEFIVVAERSGLILDIGTWVLREACRQAVSWLAGGVQHFIMSVNVSTIQFRTGNLPQLVAQILAETGLPGSCLELEITETGIMQDMHVAAEMLVALHAQGVGLAIDDFGTGYSSLSYLRKVPVDRLKIDKSFINDVTVSEDAAVVAATIVQLARSLRLKVVAEGVETRAQAEFVHKTGCEFVQGYYFAKPMHADAIPGLLRRSELMETNHE